MREIKEEKKRAYGVGGPTQKEVVPVNLGLLDAVKKIIANSPDINYDITGMTPVYEKDTGVPIAQKDVPPAVQPTVAQKGVGDKTVPTEPVTTQTPQVTQPQAAPAPVTAPTSEPPITQHLPGEQPWERRGSTDVRITKADQFTAAQKAAHSPSSALIEARGIGGGKEDDTSIEGIAKMILYDNTLLPAQKASALAKLRSIEAGPNATVQAAKIAADASMTNVQKTIDQQIATGKMTRDLDDPYNRLLLANELGKEKTIEGTETQNPRKGAQLLDEYDKLYRGKKLAEHEEYLLANYKKDKKAMKSYDEKFGEGAAARVIALYLEKYLRERDNKAE